MNFDSLGVTGRFDEYLGGGRYLNLSSGRTEMKE